MIIVRVELHSAITGEVTEIAKMKICNVGRAETPLNGHGAWNYSAESFIGRTKKALNLNRRNRVGQVKAHQADRVHVWYLIAKALESMGYKGK